MKGLPVIAEITSSSPQGDHSVETIRPSYEDAYTLEYMALYDNIVNGSRVKTDPEDGECPDAGNTISRAH